MRGLVLVVLLAGLCGCSGDDEVPNSSLGASDVTPPPNSFHTVKVLEHHYDVTYQPDTIIVDQQAMQFMRRPVLGANELVFTAEAEPYLQLEVGKVTIFPMAALVRVESIHRAGGIIVVKTSPAILTEAISEADIKSLTEISWAQLLAHTTEEERTFRFTVFPQAVAAEETGEAYSSLSRKFGPYKGLTVNFKLKPEAGNTLGFEITAKASKEASHKPINQQEFRERFGPDRYFNANEFQPVASEYADNSRGGGAQEPDYGRPSDPESSSASGGTPGQQLGVEGGTNGFLKATGQISGVRSEFNLQIRSATVSFLDFDFSEVKGHAKLESVSLAGLASTFYVKIPIKYSITVPLGGVIPLTFTLGADFSFRPIVEKFSGGSAKLCMVVTYDGSTGLEWSGGSFSNQSQVSERTTAHCEGEETVSAGTVTVGMGSTVTFPSFEVSLFHLPASAGFDLKYNGVTTYEPGIKSARQACQAGKHELSQQAKAQLKLFGLTAEVHAKLWDLRKEWTCDDQLITSTFDKAGGEQQTVADQ